MIHPETHPATNETIKAAKDDQKKQLPCLLLILLIFEMLVIVWAPFFLMNLLSAFPAYFIVLVSTGYPLMLIISCWMAKSKCEVVQLYFLFDTILVSYIVFALGFGGFQYLYYSTMQGNPMMDQHLLLQNLILANFVAILHFLFLGTCRILLVNTRWRKGQITLFKLGLLVALVASFIAFGDIIIFKADLPEQIQEFMFALVFGKFTTYFEVFARLSSIDGTDTMKY